MMDSIESFLMGAFIVIMCVLIPQGCQHQQPQTLLFPASDVDQLYLHKGDKVTIGQTTIELKNDSVIVPTEYLERLQQSERE